MILFVWVSSHTKTLLLYASINLIVSSFSLMVLICSHIYLIVAASQMQAIFREFGHVRGYAGEKFLLIVYFFFSAHLAKFIIKPIVIYKINTSNFACSENFKRLIWVVNDFDVALFPLCFKIIFVGVVWELSRIENTALSHSYEQISTS